MTEQDRRKDEVTPIVERRGGTEQRVPEWLRREDENGPTRRPIVPRWIARKNESGLPPKDMSGTVAA